MNALLEQVATTLGQGERIDCGALAALPCGRGRPGRGVIPGPERR